MKTQKVPTSHLFLPITRKERDGETLIVEAYAYCNPKVKSDKFDLTRAAMEEATEEYFKFPAIREMHGSSAAGTGVSRVWDEKGCLLTLKVVDPNAIKKVEEEVYRGLSVGVKPLIVRGNEVTKCQWIETSLVDRPADPDAIILTTRGEELPEEVEAQVYEADDIARAAFADQMKARENRILRSAAIDTLSSVLYDALCYGDGDESYRATALDAALNEFRSYVLPLMQRGERFIEVGEAPILRADVDAEIGRRDTQISALRSERDEARADGETKAGEIARLSSEVERLGKMPVAPPPARFPEAFVRTFQANAAASTEADKAKAEIETIDRMSDDDLHALSAPEREDLALRRMKLQRVADGGE